MFLPSPSAPLPQTPSLCNRELLVQGGVLIETKIYQSPDLNSLSENRYCGCGDVKTKLLPGI